MSLQYTLSEVHTELNSTLSNIHNQKMLMEANGDNYPESLLCREREILRLLSQIEITLLTL